jgi:hypothetical protein
MSGSDEVWRRVEANKQLAQKYLTEHEPHFPAYYKLPEADYHYVCEAIDLLTEDTTRCGARARLQQYPMAHQVSMTSWK